jgi:ABC-type multidrug transport system fused ATPase/permease subunit
MAKLDTAIGRIIGLSPRAAAAIAHVCRREWHLIASSIVVTIAVPILELALVSIIFAIVDPSDVRAAKIGRMIVEPFGVVATESAGRAMLLAAGVISVAIMLGARFLQKRLSIQVMLRTYLAYGRELVARFLATPPGRNAGLNRSEFANTLYGEVWFVGQLVFDLVNATSQVIAIAVLLSGAFFVSPQVTALAGVLAIGLAVVFRSRYRLAHEISRDRIASQSHLLGRAMDVFDGYSRIRQAGAERTFAARFGAVLKQTSLWREKHVHNQTVLVALSQAALYFILLGFAAAAVVWQQRLSSGIALVLLVLLQRILSAASMLQQEWLKVKTCAMSVEKVTDLMARCGAASADPYSIAEVAKEASGTREPVRSLVLDGVSFAYAGKSIYEGISIAFQAGDRVLIQGPSGIGKSTFGMLAVRLLEPTSGRVLVNDEELSEEAYTQRWRQEILYVAPDLHVFDASIAENALTQRADARMPLPEALGHTELASVADRLERDGTPAVGVDGSLLSLGERQRVLLLEAFMKRPSLLILDEATSNLDRRLEDHVLSALLQTLAPEAIVVVISHKAPRQIHFTRQFTLRERMLVEQHAPAGVASVAGD